MDNAEGEKPPQAVKVDSSQKSDIPGWRKVLQKGGRVLAAAGFMAATTTQPVEASTTTHSAESVSGEAPHTVFDSASRIPPDVTLPRQTDDHDINPITADPLQMHPSTQEDPNSTPADPVDLNNIYVKNSSSSDEDGNAGSPDSSDSEKPDPMHIDGNGQGPNNEDILPLAPRKTDVFAKTDGSKPEDLDQDLGANLPPTTPPQPQHIDGNALGPNGEDILPIAPKADSAIFAKADNNENPEPEESDSPTPIPIDGNGLGPDNSDILPMVPRDGSTIMAKVDANSVTDGSLPVPPDQAPEAIPMMKPDRTNQVAMSDPTSNPPMPEKPDVGPVLPLMQPKDDGNSTA